MRVSGPSSRTRARTRASEARSEQSDASIEDLSEGSDSPEPIDSDSDNGVFMSEKEGKRPAKRVKRSHTPDEIPASELMFFKNERLRRTRMKGFALMSLPLEIILEVWFLLS
jgi:hypothetical protein